MTTCATSRVNLEEDSLLGDSLLDSIGGSIEELKTLYSRFYSRISSLTVATISTFFSLSLSFPPNRPTQPIPMNNRPIHNYCMKDLYICFSNLTQRELAVSLF